MVQDLEAVEGVGFVDDAAGRVLDDGGIAAGSDVVADDTDMIQVVLAAGAPKDDVAGLPVRLRRGNRQLFCMTAKIDNEIAATPMVDIGVGV